MRIRVCILYQDGTCTLPHYNALYHNPLPLEEILQRQWVFMIVPRHRESMDRKIVSIGIDSIIAYGDVLAELPPPVQMLGRSCGNGNVQPDGAGIGRHCNLACCSSINDACCPRIGRDRCAIRHKVLGVAWPSELVINPSARHTAGCSRNAVAG